ncbi:DNA helicase RecQ [Tissierella creatinini]|nr:DNA helicase RecQ [Tissierella creatinini]TJX65299.1 DNA helicase RecQ [Soehngenia saccharolytica]
MDIYQALQTYFGYDEFKAGQKKIVEGALGGKDVLGIMPTGGGKSLCYQLPAILMDGITLVISPLISLMKDQVDSLEEIGIPGTFINSTLEDNDINYRLQEIRQGNYKIVYVAPERLNTYAFTRLVKDIKISMVAIDEAHCISQWGHDFRPSYAEIPKFILNIPRRPVVAAYTATATRLVVDEIKDLLGLRDPLESIIGFDRPNLFYQVVKVSNKLSYVNDYLKNNFQEDSGIIYCATRKTVEAVTEKLNLLGYSVVSYHGGMDSESRQKNQDDFILNKVKIIVATNAFGMGIDKPDVRFVIHYNMPQNMEAYYQEAGRAGRDGEPSDCTLLYSPSDIVKQKLLIQNSTFSEKRENILYENLQYLVDYCNTNDCLRSMILEYFGEDSLEAKCHNCGNCVDNSEMVDITLEAQKILSCIYRVKERFGVSIIINVLRGSKNKRILEFGLNSVSTYGIMKEYSEGTVREIIMTLISMGYILVTADKFPVLRLSARSRDVLNGNERVYHKKHLLQVKPSSSKSAKAAHDVDFDEELFLELRDLRYTLSQEKGIAPFMVFHDSTLKEMAAYFPQSKEAMLAIKGVGEKKYESYGQSFLEIIRNYAQKNEKKERRPFYG